MNPNTEIAPEYQTLVAQMTEEAVLPRPSGPAMALLARLEDEQVKLPEIARLIQADPVLTARLVKLANAPVYRLPRPAARISPEVLMRIGLTTVRHLVFLFGLIDRFRAGRCPHFDYPRFWQRSLLMGLLMQHLGNEQRLAPASELFTLGLLFFLGELALAEWRPEAFAAWLEQRPTNAANRSPVVEVDGVSWNALRVTKALWANLGFPNVFLCAVQRVIEVEEGGVPIGKGQVPERCERLAALFVVSRTTVAALLEAQTETGSLDRFTKWGYAPEAIAHACSEVLAEWPAWLRLLDLSVEDVASVRERVRTLAAKESSVPLTFIVIDDDPILLRLLSRQLDHHPEWRVVTFQNPGDALAWLERNDADVAIVDLLMPETDGWEVIQRLRALPNRDLHIVALSILGEREHLVRAFEAGADDYLTKPFDPRVFEIRLIPVLRRKATHRTQKGGHPSPIEVWDDEVSLFTRNYLSFRLVQEVALAARLLQPLSLLLIEFSTTDRTQLLSVVHKLTQLIRASDLLGAFAPGMFYLLLPATPSSGVAQFIRRLCATGICGDDQTLQCRYRAATLELDQLCAIMEVQNSWEERVNKWLETILAQPAVPLCDQEIGEGALRG